MTTVTSGSTVSLFNGYGATVTITPGSGGRVSVSGRLADGGAITPREIYSSTSISAPAGSTLSIEAVGADADYQTVLDDASRAAISRSVGSLIDLSRGAVIGDSYTNRMWRQQSVSTIVGNGSVATVNLTGHALPTGSRVRVTAGTGATGLRTLDSVVTVVDANTLTYPSTVVGTLTSPNLYGFAQPADYGWANWFRAMTGITWASNYGVGGATSVQLADYIPALQSAAPSIVFAQYGINDANTLGLASTDADVNALVAQVVAVDDALVAACAACGAVLVLSTIPPEAAAYAGFGTPRTQALLRINQSRRARRSFTVRIADEWASQVNGLSTTGAVSANWIASDNLHPNTAGALRLANLKFAACSDLLPPDPRPRVSSYTETSAFDPNCKQVLPNPTFTGAGPTADLWTTAGANWTPSLVARADGKGNNQRLVAASATVNGTLTSNSFHTQLSAGKRIKIGCEITVSGITSMLGFRVELSLTQNGTAASLYATRGALTAPEGGSIPAAASGVTYYFESEELELAYAPTNAQFIVTGNINGTSSVTIDVGTPRVDVLN